MKNKKKRLNLIADLLRTNVIGSQEELLKLLQEQNCDVTQATLSRDLKQLKVAKTPLANGTYKYILPPVNSQNVEHGKPNAFSNGIVLSIEFAGQLAVIKTKPGYANVVAWDIDNEAKQEVMGTIAGDDTILLVMRDGISRDEIIDILHITFAESKE